MKMFSTLICLYCSTYYHVICTFLVLFPHSIGPSKSCGPFRLYSQEKYYVWSSIINIISSWPKGLSTVLFFLGTAAFFIPVIVVLWWVNIFLLLNEMFVKLKRKKNNIWFVHLENVVYLYFVRFYILKTALRPVSIVLVFQSLAFNKCLKSKWNFSREMCMTINLWCLINMSKVQVEIQ